MTETTICAGCGATVATGDEFCPTCARALVGAERDAYELRRAREEERTHRMRYLLFVLFIVIMALGYQYLR